MAAKSNPGDRSLLEETERLITCLVRQAGKKVAVREKDGEKVKTRYVMPLILDQARAADAALKFLAMKNKMPEPPTLSDFERGQMELDNERDA